MTAAATDAIIAAVAAVASAALTAALPLTRPPAAPRDRCDGVDVFDHYFKERTVRACSRCMRTSRAERRPNAPLITPARLRLALQRFADHLMRALRQSLPVRSFRNLHRLWRHRRCMPHAIRYGPVPFERARDRPCPPLLCR